MNSLSSKFDVLEKTMKNEKDKIIKEKEDKINILEKQITEL